MKPRCIVSDLDRTLTTKDLALDPLAVERIRELRSRGFLVVVATGRRLDEVRAMGLVGLVDGVVAENGAVISVPEEKAEVVDRSFAVDARQALRHLAPSFSWGQVVGSGPRELAKAAAAHLEAAGLAHAIEFNAEHLMLLPRGVDKASGAEACVRRLGSSAEESWAIGDGENDAVLLRWARVGAAPANAAREAVDAADVRLLAWWSEGFLAFTAPLLDGSVSTNASPFAPSPPG